MVQAAEWQGPDWARNQPVYQLSFDRQTAAGTFRAFEERLPELMFRDREMPAIIAVRLGVTPGYS